MVKIRKFWPGESILLRNFAPVAREVSPQEFLPVLPTLSPKISIWYFRPRCDQLVLLTMVRPNTVFATLTMVWVFPYLRTLTSDATNGGLINLKMWLEEGHGLDFYLTQVMSDHEAFDVYLFCTRLMECKDHKMMMPLAHPVSVSSTSTVPERRDNHRTRDGWAASYTRWFSPNHATAPMDGTRWPLCRFDNASQDGFGVRTAEAAISLRNLTPNGGPHHQHCVCC